MLLRVTMLILLSAPAAFPAPQSSAAPQAPVALSQDRSEWRAIYRDGEHIGYQRTQFRTESEMSVTIRQTKVRQRGVQIDSVVTVRSDADGIVQTYEQRRGSDRSVTTIGTAKGGVRPAGTQRSGRTVWSQVSAEVRSPLWFERQLVANPMPPGTRMRLTVFDNGEEDQLVITSGTWRKTTLPNRRRVDLLPITVQRASQPSDRQKLYMNERGQVELAELPYRGMKLLTQLVPRAEAQTEADEKLFDLTLARFIPANRPLAEGREAVEAVYIVSGSGGLMETLNHEPRQLTTSATDGAIEVTVTAPTLEAGHRHVKADRKYLDATTLLDHRDRNVQQFAAESAAGEFDTMAIATKLQRAVGRRLRSKSFSAATEPASGILQAREGDCTEHAVLLAAALRSRRIPSRIATGLIYIEGKSGFTAHMWVEAMINGEWVALDATFARRANSKEAVRVPGAGYVTVAHSVLADEETVLDAFIPLADLMSSLSIEIMPPK